MAFAIGSNDVANTMGTAVGSRSISIRNAIILAAIFEGLGAFLAGSQVTESVRGQFFSLSYFSDQPMVLVIGMLSALLASGIWLILATRYGWPVSTTHSIIGSLLGFALMTVPHNINFVFFQNVTVVWLIAPLIAVVFSYLLMKMMVKQLFNQIDPLRSAQKVLPVYLFIITYVIYSMIVFHGLWALSWYSVSLGLMISTISVFVYKRYEVNIMSHTKMDPYQRIEYVFTIFTVLTAGMMAFSHGSNDVANAIGPVATVLDALYRPDYLVGNHVTVVPWYLLALGAIGIVSGLAIYGYRIIETVGKKITYLSPSRSFCAQLSTSIIVMIASYFGFPVSTTQILVGAIVGVGFARGIAALNFDVVKGIFMSWVITLPAGALITICIFKTMTLVGWML
ncbi:MAG: inorganic phosphate transporter [Candidatus Comchoanobacterales bacterium]